MSKSENQIKNIERNRQTQEAFLETHRREKTPLSIFLVSGIRLIGSIEAFDRYAICLSGPTGTQHIYKHSISTILPASPAMATAPSPREAPSTESNADKNRNNRSQLLTIRKKRSTSPHPE